MKNLNCYRISKIIFVSFLLTFLFSEAFSEPLINISLNSKRVEGEYYYADVWANVPDLVNSWNIASATILIKFNNKALSLEELNGIEIENLDFDLLQNNCTVSQTQFDADELALNIFTTETKLAKHGSFRIGTIKWKIIDGTQLDNIKFYTNEIEIFNGLTNMLDFGCNSPDCYKIDEPIVTIINDAKESRENNTVYNFPNPNNGTTDIHFKISNSGNVKISIYSIDGRLISNFVDAYYVSGSYSKQYFAANLPSGIYSIVMNCDSKQITNKMIIQK